MKVINTNLLNHFWKNGVRPIIDEMAEKICTSKIVNNLLTTAAGYVLDARQGKVLQDEVDEIANALSENQDVVEALGTAIGSKANEVEFNSHKKKTENLLGNTDISKIGDGTITGALSKLNTGLDVVKSNLVNKDTSLIIETISFGSVTLKAISNKTISANIAKTGYHPLCVAGFTSGNACNVVAACYITGPNAYMTLTNYYGDAQTGTPTVNILYLKK